jgi:L-amino acid N-acyltransferase YncA
VTSDYEDMIRPAVNTDAENLCAIYNHFVKNSVVTFEEEAVSAQDMAQRITEVTSAYPWLVFEADGQISGYAYASRWRKRVAYRNTAEVTVYVAPDLQAKGVGTKLYQALIEKLRKQQFHCALGGIALPNQASIAVHEKLGFQKVAEFSEVGRKFGRWVDVAYWQLIL